MYLYAIYIYIFRLPCIYWLFSVSAFTPATLYNYVYNTFLFFFSCPQITVRYILWIRNQAMTRLYNKYRAKESSLKKNIINKNKLMQNQLYKHHNNLPNTAHRATSGVSHPEEILFANGIRIPYISCQPDPSIASICNYY